MIRKFRGILILFSLFFVNLVFAQVQISEIAWMGTSASSYDEWIELYNNSDKVVNLSNWKLSSEDGSPSINLLGQIPAKSYFLLERTDDTTVPEISADQIYTGSLSNSGEVLILFNALGEIVDKTPKGVWAKGENSAKKTMERKNFQIYGDKPEAWQTFLLDSGTVYDDENNLIKGTPKNKNSIEVVPELSKNLEFISKMSLVEITKINPVLIDSEDSWLEFRIKSNYAVDITDWEISNGKDSQKFSELGDKLVLITDSENLAGSSVYLNENGEADISEQQKMSVNFKLPRDRLIFSAKNSGEDIIFKIKNQSLFLPEDHKFKILNNGKELAFFVFAKDLQVIVSEISPLRDKPNPKNDFFELYIKKADDVIDLKFLEVLHNGKRLFFAGNSLLVKENDLLTFQLLYEKIQTKPSRYRNRTFLQETGDSWEWIKSSKNGINNNSGTMEVILWSGTNWEQVADFACWEKKKLSKTEKKRVLKNSPNNWRGQCISTQNLAKNESIARSEPQTDVNMATDFYRHFHGSPGERNFIKNYKPRSRIKIQSGKFKGEASVNFTGLEKDNSASTDGDGLKDIVSFQWEVDGKACGDYNKDGWEWVKSREKKEFCGIESQKSNPGSIYFNFEKKEKFEVALTIRDITGAKDTSKKIIYREKTEEVKKSSKTFLPKEKENIDINFFAEFLETTDISKLKEIAYSDIQPPEIEPAPRYLFARDKFSAEQKSRIAKNISLIYQ